MTLEEKLLDEKIMRLYFYVMLILNANFLSIGNNAQPSSSYSMDEIKRIDCEGGLHLADSVCIPKNYLKGQVPKIPTVVASRLEISAIRDVNDKKMLITLEIYLESLWIDNRLKTSLLNNEFAVLNNNLINMIWKPDLWIRNLFSFRIHTILEPTGGLVIMHKKLCKRKDFSLMTVRNMSISGINKTCEEGKENEINSNLLVMYNMEAQIQIYCNFHFESYPMDTQGCDFVMNSAYPYPDIVNLSFEQGQFGATNNNLNIDDFRIKVIFQDNSSPTGIRMLIELERRLLPFILKYYLPAMAIAVVSLVNYLIPVDCMPARVSLLVTQFLTLTNILIYQQVS